MKIPGMPGNLAQIMKQAQQAQEKLEQELEALEVEASVGGDMVVIRMNGKYQALSVTVNPEIQKEEDVSMIQDLILSAVNEATRKVNEARDAKVKSAIGAGIPGLGNLF
jgi:DNA-binding YbaB/EbfC family protein